MKSLLKTFLIIPQLFVFASLCLLSAQPDPEVAFNVTNPDNSDYQFQMSFSYKTDYCNCGTQNTLIQIYEDVALFGPLFQQYENLFFSNYNIRVGPEFDKDLIAVFVMTGQRQWNGTSAGEWCAPLNCNFSCDCGDSYPMDQVQHVSTSPLKNPIDLNASTGEFPDKIVLTWGKGTDFPDNQHKYYIYRKDILIDSVPGSNTTYTDSNLPQGESYDYTVKTHISSYGVHFSSGVTAEGSTFAMDASDGEFYNRVRVKWSNVPDGTEDVRIERSTHNDTTGAVNGREEVVIMSASATTYNDNGGIPGFNYDYYVSPLVAGAPIIEYSDQGFSKPNGKITGHVRSSLGTGVPGIDISVELLTTGIPTCIPTCVPGGLQLPVDCTTSTYCTSTDVAGYYEIPDVYYYKEADFRITPIALGHDFTPDTIVRTLNENGRTAAGIDFTDETVFTVSGRVYYPPRNGDTCGIKNAKILIDTVDFGIKTDAEGKWSLTLFDEKEYSISIDYFDHHFENESGDTATTLFIDTDVPNMDFEDKETGDITVVAQGGCMAPLGDSVKIRVSSPPNCFDEIYWTDAFGNLTINDLPARDYIVEVMAIDGPAQTSFILDQIGAQGGVSIELDLTSKDSIWMFMDREDSIITPEQSVTLPNGQILVTPADTIIMTVQDSIMKAPNTTARFIYRSPLDISTNFEDAGAVVLDDPMDGCMNSAGQHIILMEQGVEYPLIIDVSETLGLDCSIDAGFLIIYDNISDREETPIRVPIINGTAEYSITAGAPVIASNPTFHDHEKFLYIVPEVDQLDAQPVEFWALVTGTKSNVPSLITRSPEIPMLIVHDPPGDNSYAFVEKGQAFKSFITTSYLTSEEGGGFLNLEGGFAADIFSLKIKLGAFVNFEMSGGRNDKNEEGFETVMTFTERFTTSSADNFTGDEGDVYIGASFNQEFSNGESLTYDVDACSTEVRDIPNLDLAGFATTFFYTEKHIKQTLLPTIAVLMEGFKKGTTKEDTASFNSLRADSVGWGRILYQNDLGRDSLAIFDENLTFSAGASVDRSYSTSESSSQSYEYETFISEEFSVGGVFEYEGFGGYLETKAGGFGKFKQTTSHASGTDTSQTRTIGYVLDDGDIGDFFSVDVKRDTFFNVPSFKLKLGTSSCPHEEGTQSRDKPSISLLPPTPIDNVPADGEANFVALLTNNSDSRETREYHVRVVSTTNRDGAQLSLGARNIVNGAASFFLEYNQTLPVALTVKKGPLASNYERIGVMIYPPCEYSLWQDNGVLKNVDTTFLTVNFQSECTNVNLFKPGDGWLVNQNNGDILEATLTGYDINNIHFESIAIQLKREGEGYTTHTTIPKDSLMLYGAFYDVALDVSNFDDGNYRLRARANCAPGVGYTYSSEQLGIIDRGSLAPFGTPSPSDGFLQEGQEISVTYDKDINCDLLASAVITLVREDTDAPLALMIMTECLDNKLILVTDPPLVDIPDLDGVNVTARVHLLQDLSGNVQKYPVEWTFKVNAKPVFWDPDLLYASAKEGESTIMTGVLKNDALLSKSYSLEVADVPAIISFPDWLTPMQTRGTVLSNNDFEVDFAVDPDLPPGIYEGVVTAAVDSLPVSMDVVYELLAKPVNWSFDPNLYEYSMNVVTQFSLSDADAPLSDDPRDLVGAFVNGEIRGIANIEFIPNKDAYAAFLTVYSDDDGGNNAEDIQFRYWHALSGIEYKAIETLPFQIDDANGSVDAPFILHPEGIFQVIPLNVGWNWISFNVENQDMSREKLFESLISAQATNTILIKSQSKTTEFNPNSGWQGNLSNFALGDGYLVHLSDHVDTLRVPGFPPANPVSIDIDGPWNWIGYPEQDPRLVGDVLSGVGAVEGDMVKSQHAFSAYDAAATSWIGNLHYLIPGKGYKLSLSNNGTIDYQFGEDLPDASLFEYNMNVTGVLDPDMLEHANAEDLKVSAYIDGNFYAEADLEYVSSLNEYRVLLLIPGNVLVQDAQVELRVTDEQERKVYFSNGDPISFTLDGIIGTVMDPYYLFQVPPAGHSLDEAAYELLQNVPNPVTESTSISFRIPIPENVTLDIFDTRGNLIKTVTETFEKPGVHSVEMSLHNLPSGIYFYRMITPNFSGTKKLVKK